MDQKVALFDFLNDLWKRNHDNKNIEQIRDWMFGAVGYAYEAHIITANEKNELFQKYQI